jgi:hypothetical protein
MYNYDRRIAAEMSEEQTKKLVADTTHKVKTLEAEASELEMKLLSASSRLMVARTDVPQHISGLLQTADLELNNAAKNLGEAKRPLMRALSSLSKVEGYSRDRWLSDLEKMHGRQAAGPVADKLHKGFTELQHAITTIDQVEFQTKGLPPNIKNEIKSCVKELETTARKMEKIERDTHVWEASK